jgi:hypothetical protein
LARTTWKGRHEQVADRSIGSITRFATAKHDPSRVSPVVLAP